MKTRILSAAVGIVLFIAVVYFMPPQAAIVAISFLCAVAAHEMLGTTGVLRVSKMLWVCCVAAFFVPVATTIDAYYLLPVLYLFTLVIFLFAITHPKQMRFEQIAQSYLGAIVVPYLLSSVLRILVHHGAGKVYVLLPFVAAWCSDTMALVAGMLFGKHKLIPAVSPKKTIEGSLGGLLGSVIGMLIFGFVTGRYFHTQPHYLMLAVAGVVGSAVGQLGDLSLSLIKRNVGIKDYGKIMPGHGGVLDRFDSVLFTAPLFELLLQFTNLL